MPAGCIPLHAGCGSKGYSHSMELQPSAAMFHPLVGVAESESTPCVLFSAMQAPCQRHKDNQRHYQDTRM